MSKHKRIVFSESDCHRLVDVVMNHRDIVECKKTDSITWKKKNAAWKNIAQIYNVSTTEARTSEQLHCKFDNLKKEVRRYEAVERQNLYKTSGELAILPLKPSVKLLYDKMMGVINCSVKGLEPASLANNEDPISKFNNGEQPIEVIKILPIHQQESINIDEAIEKPDTDLSTFEDRSSYTPKLHKLLQMNHKRKFSETSKEEQENHKEKMYKLMKQALEREEAREIKLLELKMKMEEELYKQKIRFETLRNEKLELEISILKSQINDN